MEQIFIRISTPPSAWHKDMRDLVDGVSDAISLQYQSQAQVESKAAEYRLETAEYLAAEVTSSIIGITKDQLTDYGPESDLEFFEMMNDGKISCPASESLPGRESAMTVYGLLDLLVQLVAAFPNSDNVVYDTKELALRIIRTSNQPELRFKAVGNPSVYSTGHRS